MNKQDIIALGLLYLMLMIDFFMLMIDFNWLALAALFLNLFALLLAAYADAGITDYPWIGAIAGAGAGITYMLIFYGLWTYYKN